MIKINEMIEIALDYIEAESEFWDVEDLSEGGLSYLLLLIQQAVCKIMFIQMHKELEDLSDEDLEEESVYFYYDCIQRKSYEYAGIKEDENNEIGFKEFQLTFFKFIQYMKNVKVRDDMGMEFKKFYHMLKKVIFLKGDISKEVIKNRKYRYAYNKDGADSDIDIHKKTRDFWVRFIVGGKTGHTSMEILESKNMNRDELIFWLIIISINNFADDFGDDEIKELKDSFAGLQNIQEKDTSKVLCWCFNCWSEMRCSGDEHLLEFMDIIHNMRGLVTLTERFDYPINIVKGKLRCELEEFFKESNKVFSTPYVSVALDQLRQMTVNTQFPLTGHITSKGELSSDNRYISRYLRDIWKDFDSKWFDYEKNDKEKSEKISVDGVLNAINVDANNFFAYGFHMLCGMQTYRMANLLLAEKHLFFSQLESLVFSGELSEEYMKLLVSILALNKAGIYIDFDDESDDEETLFSKEGYLCEGWDKGFKMIDKEFSLLKFYARLSKNEMKYYSIYWKVVFKIINKKKIKIGDKLAERLFSQQMNSNEFSIEPNGYILWKKQPKSVLDEIFLVNLYLEATNVYCDKLEYII